MGEGQREKETQNPKQAPGSELSAQSPTRGSNSWAARSWPEPKSAAQPTAPPRRPSYRIFFATIFVCVILFFNLFLFLLKKFFFNIYLFLRQRETEHEPGRVRERRRHRIRNKLQPLSCQHRARHGARTHRPRDHDLSRSRTRNRLSHPGAPVLCFF